MLAKEFTRKFTGVVVTHHLGNPIGLAKRDEVGNDLLGRERRHALTHAIDDNEIVAAVAVRDREREGILAAAARIDEGTVDSTGGRLLFAIIADAGLDHFQRDEALDVTSEFAQVFSASAGAVLLQCTIDHTLTQRRVKRARGTE